MFSISFCEGYMNEFGELNLSRFEIYLKELSKYDYDRFEKECEASKQLHRIPSKKFELDPSPLPNSGFSVDILEKLMISAPVNPASDTNGQLIDNFIAAERQTDNVPSSASSNGDNHRPLYPDIDEETNHFNFSRSYSSIEVEFREHKNQYYREKMRNSNVSSQQLQLYVQQYIEALQWILKYYYEGCPSWSWFYPHHYAPYLSDLTNFKHLKFTFQRETPFKPFEQLLGVLPPTSRYLLPKVLQPLMVNSDSPLLHFYPEDFQLDQNEKKQDWEAIVLLPFIDEQLLLNSIQKYYSILDTNEQNRNQHKASLAFKSSSTLYPTTDLLANNPHFPPLKQTCAVATEYPVDFYRPPGLRFKYGRFDENHMIHFPKFPVLNVLPYEFEFKKGIVDIFDSRSKATTLVLNLSHRPDSDLISYNEQWDPKDNDTTQQPFQIINRQSLIERYLGKRVFVNWPHFEYGIVCAITDFRHMYTWSNIPGGSFFSFQPSNNDEPVDMKNYSQTAIYVSRFPFEYSEENVKSINMKSFPLDSAKAQMESTKAANINRRYENRQGVCIGPIPLLLYVCPLVGYRTKCSINSDKCQTVMCFSNQAFAYPLQTTVTTIPNYKQDLFSIPQTIHENFHLNDTVFSLQSPNYSCLGYVQQITKDNNGKYLVDCRMEPSDVLNQPDIHSLTHRLSRLQINYWTAQQVAEYLHTMPSIVSKVTGSIIITTGSAGRGNVSRINVGLSWKANRPVKQLYGYTKKEDQVWFYSDDAVLIISDYMLQFPEIINELIRKPKDDTYPELNIWPEKKGRSRLQEVRTWIKKLPTNSMTLMDGAWQVLDAPVIKEIDRSTKSFFAKHSIKSSTEKTKTISVEVNRLFKPNESFGMCDSDVETVHDLYDRVATVRLGTGVPLGTRGTIIGIMIGETHLDTFYEVLFDHLPKNSLDAILLGGNNQACRIKVRSYHLLNYSHSLRVRSTANYQQSKSAPNENVWEKRLTEQSTNSKQIQNQNNNNQQPQQQPTRILKRGANETNPTTTAPTPTPKSAPPISTQEKPNILEMLNNAAKEQRAAAAAKSSATTSVEKPVVSQPVLPNIAMIPTQIMTKVSVPERVIPPSNPIPVHVTETTTQLPSFSNNPASFNSLLSRAIEESTQLRDQPPKQPQQQQQQQLMNQSVWDSAPMPSLPVLQQKPNDMPISFQQPWENHSTSTIAPQQSQPTIVNQFASSSSAWEPIPSQQSRNTRT